MADLPLTPDPAAIFARLGEDYTRFQAFPVEFVLQQPVESLRAAGCRNPEALFAALHPNRIWNSVDTIDGSLSNWKNSFKLWSPLDSNECKGVQLLAQKVWPLAKTLPPPAFVPPKTAIGNKQVPANASNNESDYQRWLEKFLPLLCGALAIDKARLSFSSQARQSGDTFADGELLPTSSIGVSADKTNFVSIFSIEVKVFFGGSWTTPVKRNFKPGELPVFTDGKNFSTSGTGLREEYDRIRAAWKTMKASEVPASRLFTVTNGRAWYFCRLHSSADKNSHIQLTPPLELDWAAAEPGLAFVCAGNSPLGSKLPFPILLTVKDDHDNSYQIYTSQRLLGRGASSLVFLARHGAQDVAVKVAPRSSYFGKLQLQNERRVLRRLSGTPGVPDLKLSGSCTLSPSPDDFGGECLANVIAPVGPVLSAVPRSLVLGAYGLRIAESLAQVLASIHRQGVTVRDIKPDHIVLARDGVFLTDYGASSIADDSNDHLYAGVHDLYTPAFAGPSALITPDKGSSMRDDWDSFVLAMYDSLAGLPWERVHSVEPSTDLTNRRKLFAGVCRKPRLLRTLDHYRVVETK